MLRFALDHLKDRVGRSGRKPLVVRGARQVGKSYLVRALAEEAFEDILEINLETDVDAPDLFAS